MLLVAAILLTATFSALSNAAALLARNQGVLIGISQLITIPLMFLSSALMDTELSAGWVANVAAYNPFEWAVISGRGAMQDSPDWATVWATLACSRCWPRSWCGSPRELSARTNAPPENPRRQPR